MQNVALEAVLILVLVILNGYFAAAEISLISVRRTALKQRAEEGGKGARTALALTEDPTRLLATIQIGITLVGYLASATAAISLVHPIATWISGLGIGWLARIAPGLSVLLVTGAVAYVSLVLGELVPKRLGLQRAEKVATAVAGPIALLARASSPVVWLLTRSTAVVSHLFGVREDGGSPGVSEEEIKLLVAEQGSLLDEEKRMIHEIFGLGDTVAREIMVPRVDMVLVRDSATIRDAVGIMRESGHSRLPVFHEDHDRITGVAMLRDLVEHVLQGNMGGPVSSVMRKPVYVPETKGILPLLSEMQDQHNQLVIVVDEYGGTAGLVSAEDIIEEVVGEIADEFDRDQRYVIEASDGEWVLDGRLPIEDALGLGLPAKESDEYETMAGWVLAEIGHIPQTGEHFEVSGYRFKVLVMRHRRIAKLQVKAPRRAETQDQEG